MTDHIKEGKSKKKALSFSLSIDSASCLLDKGKGLQKHHYYADGYLFRFKPESRHYYFYFNLGKKLKSLNR